MTFKIYLRILGAAIALLAMNLANGSRPIRSIIDYGGFEDPQSLSASGWVSDGQTTVEISTDSPHEGLNSLKLPDFGGTAKVYQSLNPNDFEEGRSYAISAWYYSPSTEEYKISLNVRKTLNGIDDGVVKIAERSTGNTAEYQQIRGVYIHETNGGLFTSADFEIEFYSPVAEGQIIHVDKVEFIPVEIGLFNARPSEAGFLSFETMREIQGYDSMDYTFLSMDEDPDWQIEMDLDGNHVLSELNINGGSGMAMTNSTEGTVGYDFAIDFRFNTTADPLYTPGLGLYFLGFGNDGGDYNSDFRYALVVARMNKIILRKTHGEIDEETGVFVIYQTRS